MGGGKEKWQTGILEGSVDSNEVILHGSGFGNLVRILHLKGLGRKRAQKVMNPQLCQGSVGNCGKN